MYYRICQKYGQAIGERRYMILVNMFRGEGLLTERDRVLRSTSGGMVDNRYLAGQVEDDLKTAYLDDHTTFQKLALQMLCVNRFVWHKEGAAWADVLVREPQMHTENSELCAHCPLKNGCPKKTRDDLPNPLETNIRVEYPVYQYPGEAVVVPELPHLIDPLHALANEVVKYISSEQGLIVRNIWDMEGVALSTRLDNDNQPKALLSPIIRFGNDLRTVIIAEEGKPEIVKFLLEWNKGVYTNFKFETTTGLRRAKAVTSASQLLEEMFHPRGEDQKSNQNVWICNLKDSMEEINKRSPLPYGPPPLMAETFWSMAMRKMFDQDAKIQSTPNHLGIHRRLVRFIEACTVGIRAGVEVQRPALGNLADPDFQNLPRVTT